MIQGEPITFKIGADEEKRRNAATRIEKAMTSSYIGLKFPDRMLLIPTQNIRIIEISPPPPYKMVAVVEDAVEIP